MLYAGIDESGYGPLLGPLCVGSSAFRTAGPADAASPPDLWKLLARGVCRSPRDPRRRVAIADSKKLKGSGRQPLVHLERGVLAFVGDVPTTDAELFRRLGVSAWTQPATPWHANELPLPECHRPDGIAIARNLVVRALASAGVSHELLSVAALDAPAFNALYRTLSNKSQVNLSLVFEAARRIDLAREDEPALLAIDRQGGRASYQADLEAHLADGRPVRVLEESDGRSTYAIGTDLVVSFEVGAEERHLPVALASMAAKYVRELSMRRLNAFFIERMPRLEPTAGYVEDGRRFLAEVKPLLAREAIPEADFARIA